MGLATTGLLERERELAALGHAFDRGAQGEAGVILIEGDAGLGKSSLLDRAATMAREHGFTVLTARGGMLERTLGWGVARQLFEELVARAPVGARRSLLKGSAALAAPVLGLGDHRSADPSPLRDFHLEHGLYWLVSNLTERGSVTLLVDDLQWCDDASLEWLLYLARRMEHLPLVLAMAMRTGEPTGSGSRRELIAAEPITRRLELTTLTPPATEALLADAYGGPVDPEFGLACHDWTGGNPLFVKELADELVAEGVQPVSGSAPRVRTLTPNAASRVLLLRLGRLSEPAVALARTLAVLESSAQVQFAAVLAELGEDQAASALDELIAARVVRAGRPLGFVHPLIGAVVYNDIAPGRRAMLHKRAARLLIDAGSDPGRAAAHLLRSAPTGDPWVVAELRGAAERELARRSAPTAAQLLRRALSEPPAAAVRAELLMELGRCEVLSADPHGVQTLREALTKRSGIRVRAGISLLLGRLLLWGGDLEGAVDAARAGADVLGWEDADLRLQLEALLVSAARADVGLVALIPERLLLVRDHARDDSPGSRLIAAQISWGLTAVGAPADRCARWARRALAGGLLIAENPGAPEAYLGAIHMLVFADELDEAEAFYAQAIALAQETGSAPSFAGASCFRAYALYLAGRLEQAELLARDALRTSTEARGLAIAHGLATAILALSLIGRGEVEQGNRLIESEPEELERSRVTWATDTLWAAGRGLVAAGETEAGARALLAAGKRALAWGVITPAWLPWRSDAALALLTLGDRDEAVRLCQEELEIARRVGARRPIGVALRAQGVIEGSVELLRESCETLAGSPAILEHARSLVALGQALRRANARADSREPLTEGLLLAERCGATPLAAAAQTELAAAGARRRSVVRSGAESLTASERRVCELAAAGKSNPEIAQLLFVTRATVESHLHSAYRRLDISSRKELAAALGPMTRV